MYLNKQAINFISLVLFTISLMMTGNSFADQNDPLQIIDLKNRPADEIIPVIRPMLKPNDAITGTGFQLFLRTDAKTLEEVTRLLQVMDKAPRNLVIKVRNNLDANSKSTDINTSANYEVIDDVRVVVGDNPHRENGAKVRINSNKNTTNRNTEHMIRVIEGGKAFITAGEIRPYEHRTIIRHRNGVSVYDSVDYQDVTSGFYVTPRLTGNNNVSLQVQPHYRTVSNMRSGTIDVQEADTTLETKLGEWVQIGGIDTDENTKDSGILSTSSNSGSKQSTIYVKVELE
jgi:type II secretory pathway component GspD/PulD (secretin)